MDIEVPTLDRGYLPRETMNHFSPASSDCLHYSAETNYSSYTNREGVFLTPSLLPLYAFVVFVISRLND